MPNPSENLSELLEKFFTAEGADRKTKLNELMELMKKSRKDREADNKGNSDEDCPEDVDDCKDVLSPCCNVPVSTVFGTLPLEAECKQCGKHYLLAKLIGELLKSKKIDS